MTGEEIKRDVKIRDLFSEYGIKVDRKGFCCCPFHNEKTGSMKIYDRSNSYYCFGCGVSGDVFTFVQHMDKCDFKTAFYRLGGSYGNVTNQARMVANTQREQERKKRELKEKADEEFKKEFSYIIELLKAGCSGLEPLSDEWCFCENKLVLLLEYWECYSNGEEINEIDVYRICREIRCYFDIGR